MRKRVSTFVGVFAMILVCCFVLTKESVNAAGNVIVEYTFANNKVGNAAGTIKIKSSNTSYDGEYEICWANSSGILEDYDKITSLKTGNEESSYTFVSLNAIPSEATKVVAVKNGSIYGEFNIPQNKLLGNTKKFCFGALSDIHLDGSSSDETKSNSDFQTELDYFKSKNVALIANSGDITLDGRAKDIEAVTKKIATLNIPIFTARGNHDCRNACASLSEWKKIEPNGIIFEKVINNEVFVFLGLNTEDLSDPFTSEQISKLKEILEKYKDRRVFLFEHVFYGSVGNVSSLYPYGSLGSSGSAGEFKDLMKKYKNVISFTGHSHLDFELQRISQFANVSEKDDEYGYRVHIPSASKPRKNDSSTEDVSSNTYTYKEGALGYLVEVYNECIVLVGRDFTKNKNLPFATYVLYTGASTTPISDNSIIPNSNSEVDSQVTFTEDKSIITENQTNTEADIQIDTMDLGSEVKASSEVPNSVCKGTDVMIVIDKSLSYEEKFEQAKVRAKTFVSKVFDNKKVNVRIGVVEFGRVATKKIGLSNNLGQVNDSISDIQPQEGVDGSNMHDGVCKAVEELKTSKVESKIIIIVSDGRPNRIVSDTENHNRDRGRAIVAAELNNAKSDMNNLSVITIGYSRDDDIESKEFLKSIASSRTDGSKLYFDLP